MSRWPSGLAPTLIPPDAPAQSGRAGEHFADALCRELLDGLRVRGLSKPVSSARGFK